MDIKIGDEVRIKPTPMGRHQQHPATGYVGHVTKMARKYATAEYEFTYENTSGPQVSVRTIEFEIENGRERDNRSNYVTYVYTPAEIDRITRRNAALQTLKDRDLEFRRGHGNSLTLEQLEALAALVASFDAES